MNNLMYELRSCPFKCYLHHADRLKCSWLGPACKEVPGLGGQGGGGVVCTITSKWKECLTVQEMLRWVLQVGIAMCQYPAGSSLQPPQLRDWTWGYLWSPQHLGLLFCCGISRLNITHTQKQHFSLAEREPGLSASQTLQKSSFMCC